MRFLFLLTVGLLASTANAQTAESPGQLNQASKHCTIGDVTSALQAFEVGVHYASNWPSNIKVAGLGGSVNCQYRFYLPEKPTNGERFVFCEEDVFLGGIMWFWSYKAIGATRKWAIDDLENVKSTVSFGPAAGAQPERSLMRTGYKDFVDPDFGNTVYFQEAFVTQEEPGTYVSTWTAYYMGAPFVNVVTSIDVVTHEEHLHRVENGTWRTW